MTSCTVQQEICHCVVKCGVACRTHIDQLCYDVSRGTIMRQTKASHAIGEFSGRRLAMPFEIYVC